jgi:hypothetical protein
MRYCSSHSNRGASDMAEIDPARFTVRQVDALREALAQVMEELDLVKEHLARLPTRRDQAFVPLRTMLGSAVLSAALVIDWIELFWRHYF